MDTPALVPPDTSQEQRVFDKLSEIRNQLVLLKTDRTTYLRSQDVIPLYDETIEQVNQLDESLGFAHGKPTTQLGHVIDSCFRILSLCFLTIGRNNDAPAVYAPTTTILRLLDHLDECDLYSYHDLEAITDTLDKLTSNVESDEKCPPAYRDLLARRIDLGRATVSLLSDRLSRLGEPLAHTYEKLISLLRTVSRANTRHTVSTTELTELQKKIQEIGDQRKDGKFVAEDGTVLAGSDIANSLLDRCLRWAEMSLERKGAIPERFKPHYDKLVAVRNHLEKLSVTHSWALREADLYDYNRTLDRIDDLRVDGNWLDEEGKPADVYVQRILLYLIRRCYGYTFSLMIASQPVSEALLPVYNQLKTLKRCLIEVKKNGGVQTVREVYPYSMKLNSIDNMRVDGKFMVGDDIPEGQGSVTELLEDCFDLSRDLKIAAEAAEAQASDSQDESDESGDETVMGPRAGVEIQA